MLLLQSRGGLRAAGLSWRVAWGCGFVAVGDRPTGVSGPAGGRQLWRAQPLPWELPE